MPYTSKHTKWFSFVCQLKTKHEKDINVWEFQHTEDEAILSAWAKHFRNHYCLDSEIDELRKGFNYSRADYLNSIKFPDAKIKPGPSIRSGDFAEILVADFLQYLLHYSIPRIRYANKTIRNESVKGCDIIGYKMIRDSEFSPNDELVIFEVKAQFSKKSQQITLQKAINDSAKDFTRQAESLNAIKQRLLSRNEQDEAKRIERFQNREDNPYQEIFGAAAVLESELYNEESITSILPSNHHNFKKLWLIVIKGEQMMSLVHTLYRRAADAA